MPSSGLGSIEQTLNICMELNPESILDIGCGFGKYGFLLREYLDICHNNYSRETWQKRIDAVEIYKPYIGELQKLIYDDIWIEPIQKFIESEMYPYDLFLLSHVIEHFTKQEGEMVLKKILKTKKPLLVVTPKVFKKWGTVFGNIYETHLSLWSKKDFRKIGETQFFRNKQDIIVLFNIKIKKPSLVFKIKNFFWKTFVKKGRRNDYAEYV